ncbi:GIY-YIG nuclease family protein [Anoxynatronum buryatiense]|uniref:Endonuclease n=1 Tax=Anoxynatronum buryatiense TaxID=489973 RepID=A0AA45WTE8_9CLOT|nr:GIY-YIG nuclease family protein [Anoxynatronum buryatiense]SMP41417.1 putative endonuclease [Anoxynatronum buryatiense]
MPTVYLLYCADGSYYTGWTSNLEKRLKVHQSGRGARYTRSRLPVRLAYAEAVSDKSAALKREYQIRRLSHQQKAAMAATYHE